MIESSSNINKLQFTNYYLIEHEYSLTNGQNFLDMKWLCYNWGVFLLDDLILSSDRFFGTYREAIRFHNETINTVKLLPKKLGIKRIYYPIKDMNDIVNCSTSFYPENVSPIMPVLAISSKNGSGIGLLQQTLSLLPTRNNYETVNSKLYFTIMTIYSVPGIGTVVYGTLQSGTISVGDTLLLGPLSSADFKPVVIQSIHHKRMNVKSRTGTCDICLALRKVDRDEVRRGMVILGANSTPIATCKFKAELAIHGRSTVTARYEAIVHLNNISQTVKILSFLTDDDKEDNSKILRAGAKSNAILQFKYRPEYIEKDSRFIIREGTTRGAGLITQLL